MSNLMSVLTSFLEQPQSYTPMVGTHMDSMDMFSLLFGENVGWFLFFPLNQVSLFNPYAWTQNQIYSKVYGWSYIFL